ncbi:MAG TPA: hypothetical protein VEM14_09705, partial [Gemmatimonadaceae bacterium]|nr:hypothetical protein [Gemmatimonadaceae bacterium]
TDIHAFVEKRSSFDNIWRTHSEVFLERDYGIFAAFAGVRAAEDDVTVFEPRGFPEDASAFTQLAYYVHILPDQEFVANGLSRFVRARDVAGIIADGGHYRHKSKNLVSRPDARRPSWLSISEIQTALRTIGIGNETLGINWQLTLRSMQAIETEFQARVRLVFWFED